MSATTLDPLPWLTAFRQAAEDLAGVLAAHPSTADRAVETGIGEGGDRTLVIDALAEDAIFARLDALHAGGLRFTAVSEERGLVDYGGGAIAVVIDPIDGSLNAKRGIRHHSLSIAVASGPTMADVEIGFVQDLGPGEEWVAVRGSGARLDGRLLDTAPRERRSSDGRLEVLGIESADPQWVAASIDGLVATAHRLRAMGSIAVSLCQVADARFDGLVSLRRCRSVDAAAAQLIVREAGGHVAFPTFDDPLGAPLLDLSPQSPVVAARTPETVAELVRIPT